MSEDTILPKAVPELCPLYHRAVELIGRRWSGAIIFVLLDGRCRYSALRCAIPEITDRMLSERLKELEQEGIIERYVLPEPPIRVEYALTEAGRALATPVSALLAWAQAWLPGTARDQAAELAASDAASGDAEVGTSSSSGGGQA